MKKQGKSVLAVLLVILLMVVLKSKPPFNRSSSPDAIFVLLGISGAIWGYLVSAADSD